MITISGLGCAAAAALFFTLLPSCGRDRLVRQVESPVSKQEETLALGGADKLRGLFNKGDCQTIFRYAAFAGGSYSQKRWLDDCARLRENMGIWGGFVRVRRSLAEAQSALFVSMAWPSLRRATIV